MAILELTHYKRKGIYAYLCPVNVVKGEIQRGDFYNGQPSEDPEEKDRYYRGKLCSVFFDLASFADGVYEWKEAEGHKSKTGFVRIESGEIREEWKTSRDLIMSRASEVLTDQSLVLPVLEGSERQVSWAEQIREKAVLKGFPLNQAVEITSAKTWIDNRDRFK